MILHAGYWFPSMRCISARNVFVSSCFYRHSQTFLFWFCVELDALFSNDIAVQETLGNQKTTGSLFCCLRSDNLGRRFLNEVRARQFSASVLCS